MERLRFEACHADTCLADYWGGHHLPHVSIPVFRGMTLEQIKEGLKQEVGEYINGGYDIVNEMGRWPEEYIEAFLTAIDDITPRDDCPSEKGFFLDLDEETDDCYNSVNAYFVFVKIED